MQDFFEWVLAHWGFCAFLIGAVVQITPAVKWNPLTWVGNLFLGGVRKDISGLQTQVDENEKDRIRWEVLDFANSCRNGRKHTKDEYQHIITLTDKYKRLLEKTNDTNGVFEAEYAYIKKLYAERQEKNDFL